MTIPLTSAKHACAALLQHSHTKHWAAVWQARLEGQRGQFLHNGLGALHLAPLKSQQTRVLVQRAQRRSVAVKGVVVMVRKRLCSKVCYQACATP